MTVSAELKQRIREYLDEVSAYLKDRPESIQIELLKQLEGHINEALSSSGGQTPTLDDLESVLADMDPPESYRSETEGGDSQESGRRNGGANKWFALALCFLLLNGWAVWKFSGPSAPNLPGGSGPVSSTNQLAVLRLKSVTMATYDVPGRAATLRLDFNRPVASKRLGKFIAISRDTAEKEVVVFDLLGESHSRSMFLHVTGVVPGQRLQVSVNEGVTSGPDVPFAVEKWQGSVAISAGFEPRSLEPSSPAFEPLSVEVTFGRELDLVSARDLIEVQPSAKWELSPMYGGCQLTGDFQPGKSYAMTFKKGLKAGDGTTLDHDVTRQVVFGNRTASLTVAGDGSYLSPRGALNVPVVAMNVRDCTVRLRQIYPGNVVFYANQQNHYYSERHEGLTSPAITNRIVLPDTPNRENKFYVNLPALAGPNPRGVYHLSVEYKTPLQHRYYDSRNESQLIVVTDLGVSSKLTKDGVLVWVNSLRTAQPATNVEVVLYARNNQPLGRGRTDSQGLVFLDRASNSAPELAPSLVTAELDGDVSYLQLTSPVSLEETAGAPYMDGTQESFVFTDRGVYRPGETVHAKALVRNANLTPPSPFPVLFRVVKPDGKVFRDIPVMLNERGASELTLVLPAYLPTGGYGIKLVMPGTFAELGSAGFSIEEFVPPQIAVTLSNLPSRLKPDTPFTVAVSARHLFGSPASRLPVSADVSFGDEPFKPEAWPGYSFSDLEKTAVRKHVDLGDAILDSEGRQSFIVSPVSSLRPAAAVKATVSVTVRDSTGRPVSTSSATTLDVYPFYVGLKPERVGGHVKIGEALRIAVAAVTPEGLPLKAETALLATVEHVERMSVMKRNNGRYAWQSERIKTRVGEPRKVILAGGAGEFTFTPERAGETVVTLSDPFSGTSSSLSFFSVAGDSQWVDWAHDKPASVQLSLDRSEYAPGDKAKLAVKAPFTGPALLTVESDRVLERRLVNLTANTAEFEIDVKPGYAPNVHCVLSLIRPAVAESVWSAHRAVGAVSLKVVPAGHRLSIRVEAPKTIRPQGKLPVTVKVADADGKPVVGAELVVMAVDEGICMLTDFETPDPLAYFLRKRGLGVSLFDLYGELMPVCEDTADATVSHTGGGGGEMMGRRLNPIKANRFKPVALWASGMLTDGNGEAVVTLDVPEFTGELRVTAVAFGASVFGAVKQPVTVKRPLVVQAGLPRFLAPGDTCRMSLTIFNETGADIQSKWRVTCGGPLTATVSEGELPLKVGQSAMVPVTLTAGALPGKALCAIEVTAGAERYAETIELPVRPIVAAESRSVFEAIKQGGEVRIVAPSDWLTGTEYFDAWISGQPDVKLSGSLEWLLRYPYGCCEQTTSSSFPLLYLSDLAVRARPRGMGDLNTEQWVMAGVYRLLTMQRESGGFAMWPDSRVEEPWASIYATHFLVEAKKAGHAVPEDRLDAALNFLREQLGNKEPQDSAYICQVLAQAGRPEHGWTARLLERAGDLKASDRAHLAAALLAGGKPREALSLLNELGFPAGKDTGSGYDSRTRELALVLSAWLDIEPGHAMVSRLVHELEGLRVSGRGWWGTTQENAMALMALGKFARLTKPDKTPFEGELRPAGGDVVAFKSGKDVRWVSSEPGATKELRLVNRGPGLCWYGVRMEGVPTSGEFKPRDDGISIRRQYLSQTGGIIDDKQVNQGDLVVVRLTIETWGETLNNLVVEDLLPAGLEVENPELATSKTLDWVSADTAWCVHRELRDDRVLLFTGSVSGKAEYFYTARAVTPGKFVVPPVRVEAMYRPEILSVNGGGVMEVKE